MLYGRSQASFFTKVINFCMGGDYMPRIPRRKSSNGIYHIMFRGINRQTIFEDDQDKQRLLETLKRYQTLSQFKLYGYCVMDNHFHLLLKEIAEPISLTMKRIGVSYVYWYNNKYSRSGHLFQDRFRSEPVETERYFKTVLRYIHQNPLKANLVKNIFECQWTSLKEYLGPSSMIDVDFVLDLFSPNRTKAIQIFTEYMQENNEDQCLGESLTVRTSDNEVRKHLNQLGIPHSGSLQQMEKSQRNNVILQMKQIEGISIRQLERITGISKSVIQRVR